MSADLWAAFGDDKPTDNPWDNGQTLQPSAPKQVTTDPFGEQKPLSIPGSSGNNDALDPWAHFESQPAAAAPVSAPAQPSIDVEDEWSAFQSAEEPPETANALAPNVVTSNAGPQPASGQLQEDDWSVFESTHSQHQHQQQHQHQEPENTFDDAGFLWDADQELESGGGFSALGTQTPVQASTSSVNGASLIDISGLDVSGGLEENDDDDFGDFEQATENSPIPSSTKPVPSSSSTVAKGSTSKADTNVPAAIMQNRVETRGVGTHGRIFGATQKTAPTSASASRSQQPETTTKQNRHRATSTGDRLKPLPQKPTNLKELPKSPNPPTPAPKDEVDDDDYFDEWDDFTSADPGPEPAASTLVSATGISSSKTSNKRTANPTAKTSVSALPPTNVPPPSILLSHLATTSLPSLHAPSSSSSSPRSPNPTLRTAAHILAGRKQRWKRDTHLAQSMSISASGPGLKSGMKLTGVDKAEAAREDREAAELLRVFRTKAGALRAAASRAGEKGVVELRDGAPVKVEKGEGPAAPAGGGGKGGGGGTAASAVPGKPCVVCGLRRSERVVAVDSDVFDGFGEWWIDHWGHRECKEWWDAEETGLRGR